MALLAAYNYDEASGNFLDASGNGRDWTPNNNAARTASGHTSGGLTKGGTGMPVIAATPFGQTTARTFMFWMRGAGTAVWWFRFHAATPDTGTWGLYLLSGNLTMRLRKGGANTNTSVAWTDDGLWHHYACTYDGTNGRLYKDAVLVATSAAVTAPLDTATAIDCMESGNNTQTMDDLRIYDEALTQGQISTLMSTPVTSGGGGSSGTLTATLPGLTAALTGAGTAAGAVVATLPTLAAELVGAATGSGLLAASLPSALGALAGTATNAGTLAVVLPEPTAGFTATARASAGLAAELPELVVALAGEATAGGAAAANLPLPVASLSGVIRNLAVLGAVLPDVVATLDGFADTEESLLIAVLPMPVVALAAEVEAEGGLAATLPAPSAAFTGGSFTGAMLMDGLPALQAQFFGSAFTPGEGQLIVTLPALVAITGRMKQVKDLESQRKYTRDFIEASPVFLALIPGGEVRTPSGGVIIEDAVARPIQRFRLIPMSHTERPQESVNPGGDQRKYDMTLLGEWDAVIEANDYWVDEKGQRYVIDDIVPFNGYQMKGLVMSYGRKAATVG